MTIAEVSRLTGFTPNTLRYYERIELILPVPKNGSGARDYSDVNLENIFLLKE